jgi:hypothetical protein
MARRRKKVIWTKQGYSTLDEAVAYLAQDSLPAARQLLEDALVTAESLAYSTSVGASFRSYSSRLFEKSWFSGTDSFMKCSTQRLRFWRSFTVLEISQNGGSPCPVKPAHVVGADR